MHEQPPNFIENREYSYPSGKDIEPEKIEKIHRDFKRQEVDQKEVDLRLQEILDRVNFYILKKIFQDYAVKSGLDGKINFLGKDRISHFSPHENDDASYRVLQNLIGISYDNISKSTKSMKLGVLGRLCHEEAHAVSRFNEMLSLQENGNTTMVNVESIKSGFRQNSIFRALNEGVVEKLSREVFRRYLVADPSYASPEELAGFNGSLSYQKEVQLIEILSRKIAQEVGIDEQTVWQAFIRGLFEGEDFEDPKLETEFEEMFSKDFLNSLASQPVGGNYDALLNKIDGQRLRRFFERIWGNKQG